MGEKPTRQRIVEAADELFYQHGYAHTSFADIANVVQISRGNFYHHFKTKDEILDAVIELRLANTGKMLEQWESEGARPEERIRSFIHMLIRNQVSIMQYGCPVGTLCSELAKLDHAAREDANRLFMLFRDWLTEQFEQLGRKDADTLAMHLLARSQGVAILTNTFQDERFVEQEVGRMDAWLGSVAATAH